MRHLIILGRMFKTGLVSFGRNTWLTLAGILAMTTAIAIILAAIVLNIAAKNAVDFLTQNLEVSIYLKQGVGFSQVADLESELLESTYVVQVERVDSSQALKRFLDHFQNDNIHQAVTLLDDDQLLPASLTVRVNDLAYIEQLGQIADRNSDTVAAFSGHKTDAQQTIIKAQSIGNFIVGASFVLALGFSGMAFLIIFNTIRIAIFSRRQEINIMHLVGARTEFIRGAFLVEAGLSGLIAGFLSVALVYACLTFFAGQVADQAEFVTTYQALKQFTMVAKMIVGAMMAGLGLGLISSLLATKRYLRLGGWWC